MKEKLCYVTTNFEEESKKGSLLETEYELPDGNIITIGSEKFRTTEVFFHPNLIGMEVGGIHEHIATSIRKCDVDIRKEMYSNIVLSGGSTLFNGIAERLSNELQEISPSMKNRIIALPDRKYQAWVGGSIFASLSTYNKMCIRKEEYDETGPNIVHRK
ncbi:predicted protein [Naegleria gruberi]|uniref:Predicted protein n=1 Tax=Naegleria gruberi TaxID=5762 RepID=D2W6I4_NAEGR|nr:uncharacterized protein NAEGRDRAFT_44909 [Naegleria gruberi]EFC35319.1 predicted protein [Naegleria gruberi]|eukprot:XP_002668063.1 predicted protein [Naegleria gruberi strain NEG-M]